MKSLLSVLLVLFSAVVYSDGDDSDEQAVDTELYPDVFQLTDANFAEMTEYGVVRPTDWFIKFHAPWCGHCKKLAPIWAEVATELKDTMRVAELDITQHEIWGRKMNISRLPMLFLFRKGFTYIYPRRAPRTKEELVAWALSEEPKQDPPPTAPAPPKAEPEKTGLFSEENELFTLDEFNFDGAIREDPNDIWFVKFYAPWCGHCKKLAPTWEALAAQLKDKVQIATVDVTQNERLAKHMGVEGYPTLILYKNGKMAEYSGQRTQEDLAKFALETEPETPIPELIPSDVVRLEATDESVSVVDSGAWFVKFYAPWCGHCKKLAPTWEEVATELKEEIRVAKVDPTEDKTRAFADRFGIKSFPTLLLFKEGKMQKYDGARDKASLMAWARKTQPEGDIPEAKAPPAMWSDESEVADLNGDNFDDVTKVADGGDETWAVKFFAPWCGHCKALAPTWEAVAADLKGKVRVGKVDVTQNEALGDRFGVQRFPTLVLFKGGKMVVHDSEERSQESLVAWALNTETTEAVPKADKQSADKQDL